MKLEGGWVRRELRRVGVVKCKLGIMFHCIHEMHINKEKCNKLLLLIILLI